MASCTQCEYEKTCFRLLKFIQRFIAICRQGRKRKGKTEVPDATPQRSTPP